MKLTEDLKNKIDGAKSEEEVKEILGETKKNVEDAGVILDDTELDQAAGGRGNGSNTGGWLIDFHTDR